MFVLRDSVTINHYLRCSVTIYWWRIVDYWFSHCGVKAIERAERIDSYLTSERKTIIRES